MSPLLYPWATLPENSLALAREDGQFKGCDLRIFWEGTERQEHVEIEHPAMSGQIDGVQDILSNADMIMSQAQTRIMTLQLLPRSIPSLPHRMYNIYRIGQNKRD